MNNAIFIATSLDGFIARPDGSIDWLHGGSDNTMPGEDYGYHAFFDSVDVLVMGRHTYETVAGFSAWPYANKPVVVLSSTSLAIPETLKPTVSILSGTPTEVITELKKRGYQNAYIDGGVTIQSFLRSDSIDRMIITRLPILIGAGIPLFGSLHQDSHWQHIDTRAYASGLVQSEYRRLR